MCKENIVFFGILLCALLFFSALGALEAEEQARWFLILESELRSIEEYHERSEQEKQAWLLQAQALNRRVESLSGRAASLQAESGSLNRQLAEERARNLKLEASYEQSETDRLIQLSQKNGEQGALEQELANEWVKAARHLGAAFTWAVAAIILALAWAVFIAAKILRFLKIIP